jgi:hypothetical protein
MTATTSQYHPLDHDHPRQYDAYKSESGRHCLWNKDFFFLLALSVVAAMLDVPRGLARWFLIPTKVDRMSCWLVRHYFDSPTTKAIDACDSKVSFLSLFPPDSFLFLFLPSQQWIVDN